jgi:hypothetical protein
VSSRTLAGGTTLHAWTTRNLGFQDVHSEMLGATDNTPRAFHTFLVFRLCFDACMFAEPCYVFSMKLGTCIINFMLLNVWVRKLYRHIWVRKQWRLIAKISGAAAPENF